MTRVSVVVGLRSMSCVTPIVRVQLLPIVFLILQKRYRLHSVSDYYQYQFTKKGKKASTQSIRKSKKIQIQNAKISNTSATRWHATFITDQLINNNNYNTYMAP